MVIEGQHKNVLHPLKLWLHPNAIKLIENALKEARQGAFRVRKCRGFEKMRMPSRRSGDSA